MRGARALWTLTRLKSGIIPADAGSTNTTIIDGNGAADHPRGCGEHDMTVSGGVID